MPRGRFLAKRRGRADLILRVKEDYDGAEPSGNSVAALACSNWVPSPAAPIPNDNRCNR
jgi:uncharacterized protein YyaL (SSP411 family)